MDMIRVITYGTYDMLHYGHIQLLKRAKALGDYLVVGVTSDDYDKVRGKINNKQSLIERIEAVKATGLADEIIVEEYDGQKIDDIKRYDIDIFTVGSDWEGKFDYLNEYCKVLYLPRTEGVSSSELRSKERSIRLGIIGDMSLGKKFARESTFVNGIEYKGTEFDYDDVDAVYVVSAPEKHYEQVKTALRKGKHVLCESPIALNKDEVEELFIYADEHNLVLSEGIKTAYITAYERLVLLAKMGKIGRVFSIDATCTSMREGLGASDVNTNDKWNSICAWGPTALLPIFQILGTNYASKTIWSCFENENTKMDSFTKIDFTYPDAVASIKVAKAAKSEGELIIAGSKGYIYVPAPWWNTEYFEIRYEDPRENKRYFYQLNGEGIRYELLTFAKAICDRKYSHNIDKDITLSITSIIESFYKGKELILLR